MKIEEQHPTLLQAGGCASCTASLSTCQQCHYRQIFAQSLDGILVMQLDHPMPWDVEQTCDRTLDEIYHHLKVVEVNDAVLRQYGATTSQMLGMAQSDFFAHDPDQGKALLRHFLNQRQLCQETEERRLDTGAPIFFEVNCTGLYDTDGQFTGCVLIQRDITTRKHMEQRLQASEERYRQLISSLEQQVNQRTRELTEALAFEALLKRITDRVRDSLDEQHILQVVVESMTAGLGLISCNTGRYDSEQQISTVVHDCTHDHSHSALGTIWKMDEFPYIYHQLLAHQYFQFCDCHTLLGWVTILVAPIYDGQGTIGDLWLIREPGLPFSPSEIRLVQQVTNQCAIAIRQARLYQAAQQQVKELERVSSLKDDFLNTVSHELRTPIASIKMASEMLELSLESVDLGDRAPRIHRYIAILQAESDREIGLINDLLDLSRLEAESMMIIKTVVHLQHWLPNLIEPLQPQLQRQQIRFSLDIDANLPSLITDLSGLERIITELLRNACKYTRAHEQIRLSAQRQGTGVCIIVSNSGSMIPPHERDRVFEKFYRIPNADPWNHGGTGLGLSLVQQLTDYLGGKICLECREPWVRFIVSLPLELPDHSRSAS
ncbi:MAG TPA: ATP-binding protein [Candidatus Obscuribacterales bacterium]